MGDILVCTKLTKFICKKMRSKFPKFICIKIYTKFIYRRDISSISITYNYQYLDVNISNTNCILFAWDVQIVCNINNSMCILFAWDVQIVCSIENIMCRLIAIYTIGMII